MSLPVDFKFKPTHLETASLDTYEPLSYTRDINITEEESNQKRAEFESTKQQSIDELNAKKQLLEEAIISQLPPTELKVYYFIGRLNPPHPGHIETLRNLIDTAKTNGGLFQVVILLGSGPNGGVQTLNDPLPFRLKRKVVIDLLRVNGVPDIDQLLRSDKVTIEEMGKAARQISDTIIKIIKINETIIDIETVRFSGDKDEDMEKLSWIEKSIANSLSPIEITTNVVGIAAVENEDLGTAMSATSVRNYALESYLSELKNIKRKEEIGRERERDIGGLEMFESEYKDIYLENTKNVYDAIIGQAINFTPEEIQRYIEFKILPGTSEKKTRKKKEGGSKRRRLIRKQTKRRKTKHRNLTKRKSKLTKRRRH
jgi:hypothetical protein